MTLRSSLGFLVCMVLTALPLLVHAQATSQDDLHAAILSSLLADPRSAGIPPAQMTALVDALATQAQAQHMTAADILWRPGGAQPFGAQAGSQEPTCGTGFSGFLCSVNASFGFGGNDLIIPGFLFASSGLLVVVIRRMRINHRAALAAASAATPPWSAPL